MKWLLLLFIITFLFLYFRESFVEQTSVNPSENSSDRSSTGQPANRLVLSYNSKSYQLVYEKVHGRVISLIPNFEEKRSGSSIAAEHACQIASSGGFYTPENKPLGLFRTGDNELGRVSNNRSLLTGFLYAFEDGTIGIDSEPPANASTVLQAGPLFENGNYFPTRQDEYARRIVVIEDTQGNEYIGAVTSTENSYEGPQLSDLPPLLFSIDSPFQVNRALNLDGGSASFFKDSSGFMLSEIVAIGSVLCFK